MPFHTQQAGRNLSETDPGVARTQWKQGGHATTVCRGWARTAPGEASEELLRTRTPRPQNTPRKLLPGSPKRCGWERSPQPGRQLPEWRWVNCPSTGEPINGLQFIHPVEYYIAINQMHRATGVNMQKSQKRCRTKNVPKDFRIRGYKHGKQYPVSFVNEALWINSKSIKTGSWVIHTNFWWVFASAEGGRGKGSGRRPRGLQLQA